MLLSRIKLDDLFLLILNRISLATSGFFALRKILMAQFLNTRPVLWLKAFTNNLALTTPTLSVQLSKPTIVHLVLCLAFSQNWSIRQLDVNNAFFHGYLLEDVCITQPPSFVHPNFLDHVYKLQKALYALKQAPRAWYNELKFFILFTGFSNA